MSSARIALIVAGVAALGLLGLFGQPVDSAAGSRRMPPWMPARSDAGPDLKGNRTMALACVAMAANGALLAIAARLVRAGARG